MEGDPLAEQAGAQGGWEEWGGMSVTLGGTTVLGSGQMGLRGRGPARWGQGARHVLTRARTCVAEKVCGTAQGDRMRRWGEGRRSTAAQLGGGSNCSVTKVTTNSGLQYLRRAIRGEGIECLKSRASGARGTDMRQLRNVPWALEWQLAAAGGAPAGTPHGSKRPFCG